MKPSDFIQKAASLKKKRDVHVELRDKKYLSPDERASFVLTFLLKKLGMDLQDGTIAAREALEQPLYSDLLSFCVNFIGIWALQMDDEGLTNLAKKLSRTYYSLHYSYPEGHEALMPSREEATKIWLKRING